MKNLLKLILLASFVSNIGCTQQIPDILVVGSEASDVGNDYTKLRDFLAEGKYEEADQETVRLALLASKTLDEFLNERKDTISRAYIFSEYSDNNFIRENIDSFPCKDLKTIDQLWKIYSKGKFGFSIQNKLFEAASDYDQFTAAVGWSDNVDFREISLDERNFSIEAPKGHLPSGSSIGNILAQVDGGHIIGKSRLSPDIFDRLKACNI